MHYNVSPRTHHTHNHTHTHIHTHTHNHTHTHTDERCRRLRCGENVSGLPPAIVTSGPPRINPLAWASKPSTNELPPRHIYTYY